jgi:deoxyribonuclease-4
MPPLGSHLSIAGGYYKAVRQAAEYGMQCVQVFTKNNNQWAAKPLAEEDTRLFRDAVRESGLLPPIAHNSYLINLAASDPQLRTKSQQAMVEELQRAHALGILHVVAHPGSHGEETPDQGLQRIVDSLDVVLQATSELETTIALETTAGQGTSLGWHFDHLQTIIERCSFPDRLTICVDTCHVFAAGYSLAPHRKYLETIRQLDAAVGLHRVVVFHINDSKKACGSRVDRHEHIGQGFLGDEPFRSLVNDRRFRKVPMILETPKENNGNGKPMDLVNLERLKTLAKRANSRFA